MAPIWLAAERPLRSCSQSLMLKLGTLTTWEPILNAIGKYSWRSMVGDFAASGRFCFFGGRLGVAVWLQPIRPWVIVAFILSGAILLTHAVTFLAQRLRGRTRMGKIHFVPDAYNNGWSKQHETEMNVRVGGTFTFTGPGDVKVLRASLRGTGFVAGFDGSGAPRRMVAGGWLR
jgi:hypothetical protein